MENTTDDWSPWIECPVDQSPAAGLYIDVIRRDEWLAEYPSFIRPPPPKREQLTVMCENPGEALRYRIRVSKAFRQLEQIVDMPQPILEDA